MAKTPKTSEDRIFVQCYFSNIFRCHLIQATPGPLLSDVLIGSPILVGEDGTPIAAVGHGGGFEFGMDPIGDDPELAMVQ